MKEKYISEKFKKLDEISHVLLRPGRYIGSITPHTEDTYYYDIETNCMRERIITWVPALLKVFDEVISNSADFSKTEDGKHLSEIRVNVDLQSGEISVYDNGGIHVVMHHEHNQWIPEMIFELRSGSNFDDESNDNDFSTGQNGEGVALNVIFSKSFKVETADGKKKFIQTHLNNSREKTEPKISENSKHFTKITWIPDYEKFGLEKLDQDNFDILFKRVVDLAGCNPHLKIFFNDKLIKMNKFEDYIKLYSDDYVFDSNEEWKIGIVHSDTGFKHISFVNSTHTKNGGSHIDYISNQIVNKLREYFKKKHKVDVKPSDIKSHFMLFIDAKIKKPRYDSQTKDFLITEIKNFGTSIDVSDKFIKNLLKTEVVQSVLDWVSAKEKAQLMAELRKTNKNIDKNDPKSVDKFHDATTKNRQEALLFIVEGDSALSGVLSGRDTKTMGAFPLRGKPINVTPMDLKDILENKEFKNIMTITGLQFGVEVANISDLRFGKIILTSDADLDGFSIRGLLINAFYKFWPELFKLGMIGILNTPIVKVFLGKQVIPFYNLDNFEIWKTQNADKNFTTKYFKGLGTSSSKEWKEYLSNIENNIDILELDETNLEIFNLLFSKDVGMSDKRKEWLNIEAN